MPKFPPFSPTTKHRVSRLSHVRFLDALPGVGKTQFCLRELAKHYSATVASKSTVGPRAAWYVAPTYELLLQVAVDLLSLIRLKHPEATAPFKVMLGSAFHSNRNTRHSENYQKLLAADCVLLQGDTKASDDTSSSAGAFFLEWAAHKDNRGTRIFLFTQDLLQRLPFSTRSLHSEQVRDLLQSVHLWYDEARRCTKPGLTLRLRKDEFLDLAHMLTLDTSRGLSAPMRVPPEAVRLLRALLWSIVNTSSTKHLANIRAKYPTWKWLQTISDEKVHRVATALSPRSRFKEILSLIASQRSTVWLQAPASIDNDVDDYEHGHTIYVVEDIVEIIQSFRQVTLLSAYFRQSEMYYTIRQSLLDANLDRDLAYWETEAEMEYPPSMQKRRDLILKRWTRLKIAYLVDSPANFYLTKNALCNSILIDAADYDEFRRLGVQEKFSSGSRFATRLRLMAAKWQPTPLSQKYPDWEKRLEPWRLLIERALDYTTAFTSKVYGEAEKALLVVNSTLPGTSYDRYSSSGDDDYQSFLFDSSVRGRSTKLTTRTHGLNVYRDRHSIAFLAALNRSEGLGLFLKKRLPGYDPAADTVVESAVQAICRTSLRNLDASVDDQVLAVVSTRGLAVKIHEHMHGKPVIGPVPNPFHFLHWDAASAKAMGSNIEDWKRASGLLRQLKLRAARAKTEGSKAHYAKRVAEQEAILRKIESSGTTQ